MKKYLLASALALSLTVAQAGSIITGIAGNLLSDPPSGNGLDGALGIVPSVISGTGTGTGTLTVNGAYISALPAVTYTIDVNTIPSGPPTVGLGTDLFGPTVIDMSGYAAGTYPVSFVSTAGGVGATLQVSVVPEPHEYAMLAGLGLFGFAAYRRMRA